jgi:hypothetical protein
VKGYPTRHTRRSLHGNTMNQSVISSPAMTKSLTFKKPNSVVIVRAFFGLTKALLHALTLPLRIVLNMPSFLEGEHTTQQICINFVQNLRTILLSCQLIIFTQDSLGPFSHKIFSCSTLHLKSVSPFLSLYRWYSTRGSPCGIMQPADDFLQYTIFK